MTEQHTNLGFVSSNLTLTDDGQKPAADIKDKKDLHSIELNDFKNSKEVTYEYDPYKHREVEHPTTNMETLLHLLKGSLGTGILAMPKAFLFAGYLSGSIGTVVIGFVCTFCIRLLITCEYELCRRRRVPSLTYPATFEMALEEGPRILRGLSRYSVHICNVFLLTYQIGTCSIYTVFISANVKEVLDYHIGKVDIKVYMAISLLPLVLINYIKNLKKLAPLSTFANVITLGSFCIIWYYIFFRSDLTLDDKVPIGAPSEFPLFFGTVLFALEAIGVVMPLENEMKKPKSFASTFGILHIGMTTIVLLYLSMGLFGYMAYGEHVQGTITLNLEQSEILAQSAQLMLALAIFISHSLQCYVAIDIIWNEYLGSVMEKNPNQVMWEYVVRTMIVFVTFLLAVLVPNLDLFISLIGSLTLSMLGIGFPAFIDTCTFWKERSGFSFYFMLLRNLAITLFGVAGLIVGTYKSMHEIIDAFFSG